MTLVLVAAGSLLLTGCQNVKDLSDGIGKGSTGMATAVGATAQATVHGAEGIAQETGIAAAGMADGAGKAAVGVTQAAGSAAMDIGTGVGKTSYDAASGVGTAANNVRLGAIDTFGVRETTTTSQRFYVDELKPLYVIPDQRNDASGKQAESDI